MNSAVKNNTVEKGLPFGAENDRDHCDMMHGAQRIEPVMIWRNTPPL